MKYRKKPVVVEAAQFFSGSNPDEWPEGICWCSQKGCYYVTNRHGMKLYVADGDWIVGLPDGRGHYPCKPAIFEANYEPAE